MDFSTQNREVETWYQDLKEMMTKTATHDGFQVHKERKKLRYHQPIPNLNCIEIEKAIVLSMSCI